MWNVAIYIFGFRDAQVTINILTNGQNRKLVGIGSRIFKHMVNQYLVS